MYGSDLGFTWDPFYRGLWVVCDETGELSECERLRNTQHPLPYKKSFSQTQIRPIHSLSLSIWAILLLFLLKSLGKMVWNITYRSTFRISRHGPWIRSLHFFPLLRNFSFPRLPVFFFSPLMKWFWKDNRWWLYLRWIYCLVWYLGWDAPKYIILKKFFFFCIRNLFQSTRLYIKGI